MKQILLIALILFQLTACNSGLMIWVQGGPSFAIQSPANLVAKDSYTLSWESAGEANTYEIKISKEESCKDTSLFTIEGIKTTSVDLDFLAEGSYYLCVYAKYSGKLIPAKNNGLAITIDRFAPIVNMPDDVLTFSALFNPIFEINDISKLSIVWTQSSGDGIVSFNDPSSMTPGITANRSGIYKIKAIVTDQVGNSTTFTYQFFWDESAPLASDALLVRSGIALGGYVNFAARLDTQPLWVLQNYNSQAVQYSLPMTDTNFTLSCNASQTYDQLQIPSASNLSVDGTYVVCAKLNTTGPNSIYIKSQSVVRDTLAPIVTSLLATNEASDGYINYVERNSSLPAVDLIAIGAVETKFSNLLADLGGNLACNGSTAYPNPTAPLISSLSLDGDYAVCAILSDAAGNTTYTKSSTIARRTLLPVINVDYTYSAGLKPELRGDVSDPNATITLNINGSSYTAVNDHLGFWNLAAGTIAVLPDGIYDVVATATDAAGNSAIDGSNADLNISAATFLSSWTTNRAGVSSSTQLQLPFDTNIPYEMEIDWGDGTKDVISSGTDPALLHTYSSAGTYPLKIRGFFTGFRFNDGGDKLKINSVSAWGGLIVTNYAGIFYGASNLQITAVDTPVLSYATSLEDMFAGCSSITTIPNIGSWQVGNVTKFNGMFANIPTFNQSLATWNVSAGQNFEYMFAGATSFNQPLTTWNMANATNLGFMFNGAAAFNQNISSWNTSKVTNLRAMFFNAYAFNQPVNTWDVSKVTAFAYLFADAHVFNQPLSNWNTGLGVWFDHMFNNAWAFNQTLANFNTANALNFDDMFGGSAFNQPINNWNVSNVDTMGAMFRSSPFNQPLNNWNVSKVKNMGAMFENSPFHQGIGSWDTSSVESMGYMFKGAWQFNYPISGWNTSKVMNMNNMFESANNFNQWIGGWDTSKVTTTEAMFKNAYNFNNALENWNMSSNTNMVAMFEGTAFNQDIRNWNTTKVTDISWMFKNAWQYNQPMLWDTSSVTQMVATFEGSPMNQALGWNTSKVTNMSWMFRSNTAFNQNISAWDTSKVTDFVSMFYGAAAFNQNIGNWNTSSAVNMENMFRDSIFNQNIAGWDFSKVVNMTSLFTGSTSFSQTNYDALLARWSSQPVLNNVRVDLSSIKYSAASQAARDYLTGTKGWTINDAGIGP